ncbi:MAG: thiol peroxidase [Desulfobacterales bacterium]|nr:thiol peroxidase [Desulfobacterales bacterium]
MSEITLKGKTINTIGELPKINDIAPDFILTKTDLKDLSLKDFDGKKIVLNIFPSIDTPVCAMSVRKFNTIINEFGNAVLLCASMDLPFAHQRFCAAEGLNNVISVSELRNRSFGDKYGVRIVDGPLAGLFARAVIIINTDKKIVYTQLVPEIGQEPDYEKALSILK